MARQPVTNPQVFAETHKLVKREADRQHVSIPEMYRMIAAAGLPRVKEDYDTRAQRLAETQG